MHTVVKNRRKVTVHTFRHVESLGLFPPEAKRSSTVVKDAGLDSKSFYKALRLY